MNADSSALKYRALLEISEAFVACRDYAALLETLWNSLRPLIRFDYLALVRYDEKKNSARIEAFAGGIKKDVPLRTDLPLEGSPLEILLQTRAPLYIADLREERRFRPDLMETYRRFGILSGFWVPLSRADKRFGCLSFASQSTDAYNGEHRELMEHIARHVTIAVENALAFEKIRELRRRLEDEKVY